MNRGTTDANRPQQPKEGMGHKIASAIKSKLPDSLTSHHDDETGTTHRMDDPLPASRTAVHPPGATDRGLNPSYAASGNQHQGQQGPSVVDKVKSKLPGHHDKHLDPHQGQQGPSVVDKIKSKLPGHDEHLDSGHHKPNSLSRDNDPMSANYTGSTTHDKDHASHHGDTDTHRMTTGTGGYNTRSSANPSIGGYPTTSVGHTQDQRTAGFNKAVDAEELFGDSTSSHQQQPTY